MLSGKILIVKISRTNPPLFGVGQHFLEFLDPFDYLLVLLTSNSEGWIFSKQEVEVNIANDTWRLSGTDYKINRHTLLDRNSFSSPGRFLKKTEEYAT